MEQVEVRKLAVQEVADRQVVAPQLAAVVQQLAVQRPLEAVRQAKVQ